MKKINTDNAVAGGLLACLIWTAGYIDSPWIMVGLFIGGFIAFLKVEDTKLSS